MDVFYGGLEAVEGTILCYLDSFYDAGYKVFKDNAIRGGKEGEDVGDELLLFRSELQSPLVVVAREGVAFGHRPPAAAPSLDSKKEKATILDSGYGN
ncbi:hypothetical protein MRB53_012614 [Persea americana]|uniref:Uncharacterized protein n=1 Tax=Persea americana TaxID=3435 RepID=A0ACC2LY53_PERAE|nr:hypothetical protein MRB53_012614 [Persea americana]